MMIEYILGGAAAIVAAVLLGAWLLHQANPFDMTDTYWGLVKGILSILALMVCALLGLNGAIAIGLGVFSVVTSW